MSVATQDIELVEYFFAHTIAPACVAILAPTVVLLVLAARTARGLLLPCFPSWPLLA